MIQIGDASLYLADCLEVLPTLGKVDAVVTDPPYGDTSLNWDSRVSGWTGMISTTSLWVFGSFRYFFEQSVEFQGWTLAQDLIWEKQNGSSFHADRFKRVHENAVHFYRGQWADLYKSTVMTNDATARTVRRKTRPPHTGHIEAGAYLSVDGGPKLMRSVIHANNCHGFAEHPTQKPVEIVTPLVEYSCPPAGLILDPFMGSGTTGVAALQLGRKFIGIEKEPAYFEIACRRIREFYAQPNLFEAPSERVAEIQGAFEL